MLLEIPFMQAFEYACTLPSFYITAIATTIAVCFIVSYFFNKISTSEKTKMWLIFIGLVAIIAVWLLAPATMAAATSPEQASRGVFILGW